MGIFRRRRDGTNNKSNEDDLSPVFRDLYTRLLLQVSQPTNLVLGISSALKGEGKSTIAMRLAGVMATDGALNALGSDTEEILLVECNQGSPRLASQFGVAATPGLMQYLAGECELEEAIKTTSITGLAVLPSGGPVNTFPVLIRARMADLLQRLRSRFALTLLDLPEVLDSTDTPVLACLTDQILLVVRAASTPSRFVTRTLDELGAANVMGIVLNDYRPDLPQWLAQRF